MKLTGCVLLLCACGALSLGGIQTLKTRTAQLRAFQGALEEMERELRCRLAPMPELLAALGERAPGQVGVFFSLCAGGMDRLEECRFAQLWRRALDAADLSLTEEDRLLLDELGGSLGRYDAQSQCAAIARVCGRLAEQEREAEERRVRLSRVYGALGLACGAFLCIILL